MKMVIVTAPMDKGVEIGRKIVEEKLAACVNLIPKVRSIYAWQGQIEDEEEVMMLCKTANAVVERLSWRIKALHPYDVPEIIAVEIDENEGNPDYFKWVRDSVV